MATIILAGGLSMRMGRDKALLALGESTLIQSLVTRFAEQIGPVIVVLRPGQELAIEQASTVHDIHEGTGPLGGLHAGLLASPDDANLLLACDMPFADPMLGRYLLSRLGDYDAAVPVLERGPEPLHAAYRKSCLTQVESGLKLKLYRMQELLDRVRVVYIPECELRRHDPRLRSFLNVNTREDYARALRFLES